MYVELVWDIVLQRLSTASVLDVVCGRPQDVHAVLDVSFSQGAAFALRIFDISVAFVRSVTAMQPIGWISVPALRNSPLHQSRAHGF